MIFIVDMSTNVAVICVGFKVICIYSIALMYRDE
jgi:hypothetical protein